eukprot:2368720-Rhodomonas_salina.1
MVRGRMRRGWGGGKSKREREQGSERASERERICTWSRSRGRKVTRSQGHEVTRSRGQKGMRV